MEVDDRVRALAEPVLAELDLDLVDIEVRGTGGSRLVRVRVDRKGGVTLDSCQEVSRRLSVTLDEQDPIAGRYVLEVTSPGVDHPLLGRRAFDRVEGRAVLIHRDDGDGLVTQVRGKVLNAEAQQVVLDAGGTHVAVAYERIVKASQTLPW